MLAHTVGHCLAQSKLLGLMIIITADVYDLTSRVSTDADAHYVEELQTKMKSTEQLVFAFVQLSQQGGSKLSQDDTYRRSQEAQTEVRIAFVTALPLFNPLYTVCLSTRRSLLTPYEASRH